MNKAALNKILIIQTASLGDVILATALLETIYYYYPNAIIDILIKKEYKQLFDNHKFINNVLTWDKKAQKYRNLLRLIKKTRSNKYDTIINVHRFFTSGLIVLFSNAKYKIGFSKNPLSLFYTHKFKHTIENKANTLHEIDRNNILLSPVIGKCTVCKPKLYPESKSLNKLNNFSESYITISPASLWFTKQLPGSKWVELTDALSDFCILLLGSKDDRKLCDSIISLSKNKKVTNLAGETNLLQTALLMKNAKMNYVNDSAPQHIASAVDAAVTVVFCSTVPEFGFGPLSTISFVVETNEKLNCKPCGIHGLKKCPLKHFKCAYNIDIKQLTNTINNG